jgi:hypothetical protein
MAAVVMTASAAMLYAIVLGVAIYRSLTEGDPVFSEMMTRTAAVLSGVVGSVVTAGFARSGRGVSVQVAGIRRDLVDAPIHWIKRNFFGLASTLGLPLLPELVLWTEPDESLPVDDPAHDAPSYEVDEPAVNKASLIISVLYFGVFFLVGLAAFVTSIALSEVPELLTNSAWVWLGSVVSSGYSFFALDSETAII